MGNLHQEGFNSCWVAQALTHFELFSGQAQPDEGEEARL